MASIDTTHIEEPPLEHIWVGLTSGPTLNIYASHAVTVKIRLPAGKWAGNTVSRLYSGSRTSKSGNSE